MQIELEQKNMKKVLSASRDQQPKKMEKSFEEIFNELERREQDADADNESTEETPARKFKPPQRRVFRKKNELSETGNTVNSQPDGHEKNYKEFEDDDRGLISIPYAKGQLKEKLLQIDIQEKNPQIPSESTTDTHTRKRTTRNSTRQQTNGNNMESKSKLQVSCEFPNASI